MKPLNPCLVSGVVAEIAVTNIDKVDMLFMVDNSNSMRANQGALRSQFPKLVQVLTTGDRTGDGMTPDDFPPVKDLHLGVVDSDMGLLGVDDIQNCSGFGDDGILQHHPTTDPAVTGCVASYPTFLSFVAGMSDPKQTATDFACIATLGTGGCGFEHQLEAPLKALWPAVDPMPNPDGSNRITFLGDAMGNGTLGHGDNENNNFLRNDPTTGLSLIAVVVVTDEEDCSSKNTHHFTPQAFLDPNDPLAMQPLNLRCYYNEMFPEDSPQYELYTIDRYINGFKALRPGNENLVIFAAITGVPVDLVDPPHLAKVDFSNQMSRDAWYASILGDPRMQEMVDPSTLAVPGAGNLLPSCNFNNGVMMARAYPPRRIVKVAQAYGENGIVQSICQQDFGPALDAIIAIIAKQLGAVCLPRPLVRNRTGLVGCNVVWELPKPGTAPPTTPTACGQPMWEFLLPVGTDRAAVSTTGGAVCNVAQLAVLPDATGKKGTVPTMQSNGQTYSSGWYYDDFSPDRLKECTGKDDTNKQRIAFTNGGKPPTGVTVKLECLNEAQSLANTRTDINTSYKQPSVGDACDEATINGQMVHGDAACQIQLIHPSAKWKDGIDRSMFCHPDLNVCVLSCNTNADCPPAWVCDTRADTVKAAGKPLCVNPTCGDLK